MKRRRRNRDISARELVDYTPRLTDRCQDKVLEFMTAEGYLPHSAGEVARYTGCSESAARKSLKALVAQRLVEVDQRRAGVRVRAKQYRATRRGVEAQEARRQAMVAREAASEPDPFGFDPATFGEAEGLERYDFTTEPHDPTGGVLLAAHELDTGEQAGQAVVARSADPRRYSGSPGEYAEVRGLRVEPGHRGQGMGTELYEMAASEAMRMGLPLASADDRTRRQSSFWAKQQRKGRAERKRHRGTPGASRYFLDFPPPPELNPMNPTPELDLRHIHIGTSGIFTSQAKKDAKAFARRHGWLAKDVKRASNRFMMFWVVGQQLDPDTYRILRKDGGVADVPFRGFANPWAGNPDIATRELERQAATGDPQAIARIRRQRMRTGGERHLAILSEREAELGEPSARARVETARKPPKTRRTKGSDVRVGDIWTAKVGSKVIPVYIDGIESPKGRKMFRLRNATTGRLLKKLRAAQSLRERVAEFTILHRIMVRGPGGKPERTYTLAHGRGRDWPSSEDQARALFSKQTGVEAPWGVFERPGQGGVWYTLESWAEERRGEHRGWGPPRGRNPRHRNPDPEGFYGWMAEGAFRGEPTLTFPYQVATKEEAIALLKDEAEEDWGAGVHGPNWTWSAVKLQKGPKEYWEPKGPARRKNPRPSAEEETLYRVLRKYTRHVGPDDSLESMLDELIGWYPEMSKSDQRAIDQHPFLRDYVRRSNPNGFDVRLRELERRAATGDPEAARALQAYRARAHVPGRVDLQDILKREGVKDPSGTDLARGVRSVLKQAGIGKGRKLSVTKMADGAGANITPGAGSKDWGWPGSSSQAAELFGARIGRNRIRIYVYEPLYWGHGMGGQAGEVPYASLEPKWHRTFVEAVRGKPKKTKAKRNPRPRFKNPCGDFVASKRDYPTEKKAWAAISKKHKLGTYDAAPSHTPHYWRWVKVKHIGKKGKRGNPALAVIGNPAKKVPLRQVKDLPGYAEAAARYEQFHGTKPTHAIRVMVPDGRKRTKRKVVAGLGRVPETHYHVNSKRSNKHGPHWVHKHPKGKEPIEVLDPETGLTSKLPVYPGYPTVTDWWRK